MRAHAKQRYVALVWITAERNKSELTIDSLIINIITALLLLLF